MDFQKPEGEIISVRSGPRRLGFNFLYVVIYGSRYVISKNLEGLIANMQHLYKPSASCSRLVTLGFQSSVFHLITAAVRRGPNSRRHGSYAQPRGISASALPYKRTPPSWLKITSQDVEENICKFAKKGLTPSQIGVILRDSHGIAQVKSVTGSKILRILKAHGLAPEIPEDLYHLIKKAVAIRKHLERNRKDKDSKFRLILVESRIHRLARYYKKTKKLPPVWKYESTTASTLVA
ncbi:ribosomal 40S subunit protein S13 [Castilleja foliolosa]|uniref:Ribosomal 40S subunit protein S13 n=1 Tax=Castilleja foliolosa TaxID=1961234 RepID=A0ABD3E4N8_9LAMI